MSEDAVSYETLLERMREVARTSYGREPEAHGNADDLLLTAVTLLAEEGGRREWAGEFATAFERVGKWYG